MELQVSHCICTEVSAKSILQRKQGRDRIDITRAEPMEGSDHSRGGSIPGSHTHAGRDTAEDERGRICRIFEREEQPDYIPATCESKIQIWESNLLVSWILCGHGRQECEKDTRVYPKPAKRRSDSGSDDAKRVSRPV